MKEYPDNHDLIRLFECEPELQDPDIPWCYNLLKFRYTNGNDCVLCEIGLADGILNLEWDRNSIRLLRADLRQASNYEVKNENETEALIVHFRIKYVTPLRIQLKPTISVTWGTTEE